MFFSWGGFVRRRRVETHLVSLTLLFIFLGACATSDSIEVEKRDRDAEVKVGRALAAAVLGRTPLLSEGEWAARSEYLRSLGGVLARRYGRPDVSHQFAWVDSDEVNAFAAPGGYIFLTRGLFQRVSSEDELVVILLHEISHVTERHVYKKIAPPRSTGVGFVLARLLAGGKGDLGVAVSRSVTQGLQILFETGLGQEYEREADQAGVAMASALGYDPHSLVRFLTESQDQASVKLRLPATHPPLDRRKEWVVSWIRDQKLDEVSAMASRALSVGSLKARRERFIRMMGRKG